MFVNWLRVRAVLGFIGVSNRIYTGFYRVYKGLDRANKVCYRVFLQGLCGFFKASNRVLQGLARTGLRVLVLGVPGSIGFRV